MAAKKKAGGAAKAAKKASSTKAARAPKKAPKRAAKKKAAGSAIVHWEIQANDAKRLQGFYASLFGWKIDANNPMNYGMVASRGMGGINGGIGGSPNGRSRVLVYASVADIDATLKKAEKLGARTIMPRTDVGQVIMGLFEDIEGNTFGLVEG